MNYKSVTGVSLIELIIAIVIIGIGLAAMSAAIITTTSHSADPIVQQQSYAIAQSYMEEILAQPFCDPNDFSVNCNTDCVASACGACGGNTVPGGGTEGRSTYDDVCDYNSINNEPASDMYGPIAALSDYSVTVTVADSGVNFNGLLSNSGQVVRIDVDVAHKNDFSTKLTAYRTNF